MKKLQVYKIFQKVRTFQISKNFWPSEISTPIPDSGKTQRNLGFWSKWQKFLVCHKFLKPKFLKNSTRELFRSGLGLSISHFVAILMPVKVGEFWLFSRGTENSGAGGYFLQKVAIFDRISNDSISASFWATAYGKILVEAQAWNFQKNFFQKWPAGNFYQNVKIWPKNTNI